jgi:uncharacterized membrane protein YfcA
MRVAHTLDATTIYVVLVVFIATLIRSTLGFGEALVAVPLLALALPVTVAAPLAVLASVVVAGVVVVQDWGHIHFRSAIGLTMAALVGIPLGVFLLAAVDDQLVKLALGVVIVGFALYSLVRGRAQGIPHDSVGWIAACGFVSGVLGGAYGMNGPPLAIYGALRGWSPQQFRATLQGYFLPASLAGLAGYAVVGLVTTGVWRYFVWSLPGVAVATVIGRALNRRMPADRFTRAVYAGLVVVGLILLAQAARR